MRDADEHGRVNLMSRKDDNDRDGSVLVNIDPEDLKDAAAHAVGALQDAGKSVAGTASTHVKAAKDWAEPLLSNVHEWLKPRVDKAWTDSVSAAAPHVETFAAKATPALKDAHDKLVPAAAAAGVKAGEGITAAHGKLVEEFLPRIVHLINEAAERKAVAAVAHHLAPEVAPVEVAAVKERHCPCKRHAKHHDVAVVTLLRWR